jgi:hypothetical protein
LATSTPSAQTRATNAASARITQSSTAKALLTYLLAP